MLGRRQKQGDQKAASASGAAGGAATVLVEALFTLVTSQRAALSESPILAEAATNIVLGKYWSQRVLHKMGPLKSHNELDVFPMLYRAV